jgi:hypothetical protein
VAFSPQANYIDCCYWHTKNIKKYFQKYFLKINICLFAFGGPPITAPNRWELGMQRSAYGPMNSNFLEEDGLSIRERERYNAVAVEAFLHFPFFLSS